MVQTLYCFDFDETLIHTMSPEPGMEIWEEKTKNPWPYKGWWSKFETLDMNVFDTPKNEWTYKKYLDAKSDPTGYLFLATGRLDKAPGMIDAVQRILDHYGFKFDDIFLNWGEDTFMFKIKLFEKMITKTGCRHFIMYDDRKDHLPNFEKWAANQNCTISVVDVVNKTVKTFQ